MVIIAYLFLVLDIRQPKAQTTHLSLNNKYSTTFRVFNGKMSSNLEGT